MSLYPGALPAAGSAVASDTLAAAGHTSLHNTGADESRAIATKIGTGSSTPTSGMLLRGTGVGTSSWAQATLTTDVTGTLPQANGGTGTTLATGTGKAVYDTSPTISGASLTSSPTITTPTIGDFTNSTHTHANNAGGGTLGAAAVPNLALNTQTLSNPYKFSVYQTVAQAVGTADEIIVWGGEEFDTNNNFASNGYTAPVNGFYYFSANLNVPNVASLTRADLAIFKNGSNFKSTGAVANAAVNSGISVSSLIQLDAGDVIEVYGGSSGAAYTTTGLQTYDYFSGFLVSQT